MLINVKGEEWQVRLVHDNHWQDTVYSPIAIKVPDCYLEEIEVDPVDGRVYVTVNERGYFHSSADVIIKEGE